MRRLLFSNDLPSFQLESDALHTIVLQPELGKLSVELWDKRGKRRHADTEYKIAGPASFEGKTDAEGRLLHENVAPGDYTLTLTQKFPEELKLQPETYTASLVALAATTGRPQIRRLGVFPRCTMSRLRGMVFDTNKTFLLPTALPAMRQIRQHYEAHNPSKLLIVGHTDTTAEPAVNDPLSLDRAKSVKQYLEDDVDAWLKNYDEGVSQKKRWGAREDRLMMLKLEGYATRAPQQSNVTWFQEHHNQLVKGGRKPGREELEVDGKIGPKTRTELIFEYMSLDGVSLKDQKDFLIDIQVHGCGENFPLDKTGLELDARAASERNDERDRTDRRVELFFFDEEYGPVPAPTSAKGQEYLTWRKLSEEDTDENVEGVTQKATFVQVPSAHFRTGSAVLLPEGESPTSGTGTALSSVGMLALALRFNEERPGHSMLLAGHADSVGSDKSNDKLSAKRAELTHAVLTGNRDTFVNIANETGKVSDWKQILKWSAAAFPMVPTLREGEEPGDDEALPEGFALADPGKIDDDATTGKPAATAFQKAYNRNKTALGGQDDLKPDGVVGRKTWGAIFDLYQYNLAQELGEDFASLGQLRNLVTPLPNVDPFIGFGESIPVDGVGKDNLASEANRRIEVLFFEQGQEPDLAVLKEDPKLSELYLRDGYERKVMETDSAKRVRVEIKLETSDGLAVPGVAFRALTSSGAEKNGKLNGGGTAFLKTPPGGTFSIEYLDHDVIRANALAARLARSLDDRDHALVLGVLFQAKEAFDRTSSAIDEFFPRDGKLVDEIRAVAKGTKSEDGIEHCLVGLELGGSGVDTLIAFNESGLDAGQANV
jgi:outer membrane protein OmpA-like peptidoglycan-associated protein